MFNSLSFVLTISTKIIQYCIRSVVVPVLEHSMLRTAYQMSGIN